ncbi:expressed unknown protein [Seminavis robusta]|uniref:Uncharacterized protein n=1 Tax=Seminavis robusta TaxID=568900 RepID=A0A9N8HKX6_9STRA|nr:expressed unknown protein [Seminavis robusta]|eukprot:Sro784_g202050.1 n/a (450) ;mRNA; f:41538-42887
MNNTKTAPVTPGGGNASSAIHYNDSLAPVFTNICTPPPKAKQTSRFFIIKKANHLLRPINGSWAELNQVQQAKLGFLLMMEQDTCAMDHLPNVTPVNIATTFMEALDPSTDIGRRLEAFVRKGGDRAEFADTSSAIKKKFHEATGNVWRENVDWSVYSIFYDPDHPNVEAFLRYQTIFSTVCWILVGAGAIFYYMAKVTGSSFAECVNQYAINLGRFMRNKFKPKEIFAKVFLADGGYPIDFLEHMLDSWKAPSPEEPKTNLVVLNVKDTPQTIFAKVQSQLETTGPLVIANYKPFSAYRDQQLVENISFSGDWHELKGAGDDTTLMHAVLVVGVRLTVDGSSGGVEFWAQDSMLGRPFIVLGWDLLKSMGVKNMRHIMEGSTFLGTTDGESVDGYPASLLSGSLSGSPSPSLVESLSSCSASEVRGPPEWMGFEIPEGKKAEDLSTFT